LKRLIYQKLLEWKSRENRKPLLLQGARQVGKTWILNEFGKNEYEDFAYFNFEEDEGLGQLFEKSLKPSFLMEALSLYRGEKINSRSTLIFFDEIQAAPRVITSLKYFCEQASEYHVVSAGSLLGVSVGKKSGFPVGKVNFMTLYPMNFYEYLNSAESGMLAGYLKNKNDFDAIPEIIHEKLLYHNKLFLYLGGLPEVVSHYIKNADIAEARNIQNEILNSHERDFSKYATSTDAIRISDVWNSIPAQLAGENKKFKYRDVSKKGRASIYELAIEWLRKSGLIYLSHRVKNPKLPLSGYYEKDKFKIFMLDTGLLGAKLGLPSKVIVNGDTLFSEYNGAFIENYVAAELVSAGIDQLCYWTSQSQAEVDFILEVNGKIIPLEVKSGYSRRKKSLRVYAEKYRPPGILRTSPRNFTQDDDFYNVPLYSVSMVRDFHIRKPTGR